MPLLAQNNYYIDKWFVDDETFDKIYPPDIQTLANRHWTGLKVAKYVADFLVPEHGAKVLDIGSGAGKFCLAAAYFKPNGLFYGIEQRKNLLDTAITAGNKLDVDNVTFLHGNFTQLDFTEFDHFYLFNPFYENINGTQKIDHTIEHSLALYHYYNSYLCNQLLKMPVGTRVATYHVGEDDMPAEYYIVKTHFEKTLKFWVKA